MPDRADRATRAILHRTERELQKLYNQTHRDIVNDLAPYWDELLIDDEDASKRERIRYAERDGMLEAAIALVVAHVLAANEESILTINSNLGGIYGTNYAYWQAQFQKWIPESRTFITPTIPDKQKLIAQMQSRYDLRAYNHATDFKYVSEDVRKAVVDGIRRGESIPKIQRRIKQTGEGRSKRSLLTTARTETTRFQNIGRMDAGRELRDMGGVVEKSWIATHDSRTRETHAHQDALDEWIPLDETFANGLDFPGDPNGDAEEVCNCRCVVIFRVVGWK